MINDDDDDEVNEEEANMCESAKTFALQHIANFDEILGKTCKICMLDELDIEERQKCWFRILKYL